MTRLEDFYGRQLVLERIPKEYLKHADEVSAFDKTKKGMLCKRCGQQISVMWQLPTGNAYCRECLVFGRLTSSDKLYRFKQQPFSKTDCLVWKGTLTPFQKEVSQALLEGLSQKKNLLVHAVTGAGKTEMIYETVARVVNEGGAVCIASPRIDVCLELYRRLRRDFSCDISLLHGESDPYKRSPLVVATTHQLMTFYQAFDLVIIDEVDAFPFVDNKALYHAAKEALKESGVSIYLTATSTDRLEEKVKKGELEVHHLARRFHANPLVVPRPLWLSNLQDKMSKGRLPKSLVTYIKKQRQTGFPLLLFLPTIAQGKQLAELLGCYFPNEAIGFVSSQTEDRLEIVEKFRSGEITVLVSTTILERGVTFACVDVFVLDSHHRLYSKSALVQIAGRVGRSLERPVGELLFFHEGQTKAIKKAIREIKEMNRKGGF
ncbi:DEAD/DEAH box helicase [Streptococcus sp. zg-JUN1979]|uniref:DEAD/DEAH box helicase n=1 Tax=Streptococcus sp. zg-JUN1979 TaxID=3391450 RepID=UPI0039A471B0